MTNHDNAANTAGTSVFNGDTPTAPPLRVQDGSLGARPASQGTTSPGTTSQGSGLVHRLYNLRISTRMLIAYGLFFLPIALLLFLIVSEKLEQMAFAKKEEAGAHLVAGITAEHIRLLSGTYENGYAAIADRIERLDLTRGGVLERTLLDDELAALRTPGVSFAKANDTLVKMVDTVADQSNLMLDPELVSFHVMDATVNKVPKLLLDLGMLTRDLRNSAGKADLAAAEAFAVLTRVDRASLLLQEIGHVLDTAFANDTRGQVRTALTGALTDMRETATRALAALGDASTTRRADAAKADQIAAPAVAAINRFTQASSAELIRLLEHRHGREFNEMLIDLGAAAVLFIMACGFAFLSIQRGTVRPIGEMTGVMLRMANGDLSGAIAGQERGDELGSMARALVVFKENKMQADRLAEDRARDEAVQAARAQRVTQLTADFERKVGELVNSVATASAELRVTAEAMSGTAQTTTEQATTVAASADQASASVQSVASAAEELASSIAEISRQVSQSARVADRAVEDARRTDTVVRALSEAAQKIGDVVSLINDIAGQTNLLALNATIEAARAGEAGRGFAVVASEVKGLATQTAKATEDIGRQIGQIQTATLEAVESIQAITKQVTEINEIAAAIAAAVEEQGSATQEIARSAQQAAIGTQQVTANIGGVSQGANITGAAASDVLNAAGGMSEQAEDLNREVGQFIAAVKAA